MKAAIRKPELLRRVPLSEYAIDQLEKSGMFPKRFPLTARVVAWNEDEVEAWLDERQLQADSAERDPSMAKNFEKNPNHIKNRARAEAHAGM